MTTFFVVCVLIMPWVFFPMKNLTYQCRTPQGIFLNLIFMGLIAAYFRKGYSRDVAPYGYKNRYLSASVAYIFASLIFYYFIPIVIYGSFQAYMTEQAFQVILALFATYVALTSFGKSDYIKIARALCLSSVLVSLFGIFQIVGYDPMKSVFPGLGYVTTLYRSTNVMTACLDNANLVGHYLALISPLFLYFREKKYYAGWGISLVAVIMSRSHFSLVCFGFATVVYALIFLKGNEHKKMRIAILLSIFLMLLAAQLTGNAIGKYMKLDSGMGRRFECWKACFELIKKNPVIGMGLGTFKTMNVVLEGSWGMVYWPEAHNDYLQYTIELGFAGAFLLLLVIINTIRNYTFKERIGDAYFCMFLTFLLLMCGSFPVEVPTLALLGLVSFWATERLA